MNVVGKVSSFITQGMYSVATPFHPFGGAVDIIVVKQEDGTFRSTPWYVRFGKFQGVLKGAEKLVKIEVNGVEANFHMHLDNSGEAYFVREVDPDKNDDNFETVREDYNDNAEDLKENHLYGQDSDEFNSSEVEVQDERVTLGINRLERVESDCDRIFYEFQDDESSLEGSVEFSEYGSSRYDNLDSVERALESQDSGSEVVLVSVDGHILTAPISSAERNSRNVELDTPQFHLGPGEGTEDYDTSDDTWNADYLGDLDKSTNRLTNDSEDKSNCLKKDELFSSCMELRELAVRCTIDDQKNTEDPHLRSPQSLVTNDKIVENVDDVSSYDSGFPTSMTLPVSQPKNDDRENTGSPLEIIVGITENIQEKSPLSTSTNDETGERNLEMSRNNINLSTHSSGSPTALTSPELHPKNEDEEIIGSSVEINSGISITENVHEISPLSISIEEKKLEMLRNDDDLSTNGSGPPTSMPLPEFPSKTDDKETTGSSVEIVGGIMEDIHETSPLSTSDNDKIEKGSLEMSINDDELSPHDSGSPVGDSLPEVKVDEGNSDAPRNDDTLLPHDSGSPGSVTLRELRVESEIHGGNTFDMGADVSDSVDVQFACNDLELQKQLEVDLAVKTSESDAEDSVPEDQSTKSERGELQASNEDSKSDLHTNLSTRVEISLCGNLLHPGMGVTAAEEVFETNRISSDDFKLSAASIIKNENLIVRLQGKQYLPWDKAAHTILGLAAFGFGIPVVPEDTIPVEQEKPEKAKVDDSEMTSTPSRRWRLWPIPFRRVKTLEHSGGSNTSNEEVLADSESVSSLTQPTPEERVDSPRKQIIRTNVPTTDQIVALNLKEGQNMVNFVFSTRVLGSQKVEAHIYLWKWNTRIVISDVDGTITKSDVLGQFMPLVGKDWTHSGIARLFSAIKENGYQLLFLSARAIVQAYLTKSFLFNLKQDGKSLPNGPVVISPDGLFPSFYREVIRRAPHEFKIACLEDIKALFPPDYNPFYAGFGNRDTDELSYRKIGIPKGKIFIINPKGEVAINHRVDVKSYTSLHTLVHDMFPPTALVEQEDYNSWNYWKTPLPDIDDL